jgi:hypothetical protein
VASFCHGRFIREVSKKVKNKKNTYLYKDFTAMCTSIDNNVIKSFLKTGCRIYGLSCVASVTRIPPATVRISEVPYSKSIYSANEKTLNIKGNIKGENIKVNDILGEMPLLT